mmetsp:Transcript_81423/g.131981  ORF Transcript_81423/g.131981 Transcript_81423/m.131981 type:complete len:92 (-) Transcript_81423:83-358(-)
MPIVRGDGNKAKSAIYDWERESRNDQSAIKEYLDQEWQKKMRKKRDSDAGKSLRSAAKTGDAEAVRYVNTDRGRGERYVRVRACVRMCERK